MRINNRWFQLCASLVAMIMIANLQYAWTLFVKPMQASTHWKLSDTMAHEPQATLDLMLKVWRPAVEQLRHQIAQMQKIADAEQDAAGAPRFTLQPWDLPRYRWVRPAAIRSSSSLWMKPDWICWSAHYPLTCCCSLDIGQWLVRQSQ